MLRNTKAQRFFHVSVLYEGKMIKRRRRYGADRLREEGKNIRAADSREEEGQAGSHTSKTGRQLQQAAETAGEERQSSHTGRQKQKRFTHERLKTHMQPVHLKDVHTDKWFETLT